MSGKRSFENEDELIGWLRKRAAHSAANISLGIGDDAALVRPRSGYQLILTTDMSIEGVHFSPALHPAKSVGHRALARSLSDIAAMGGAPKYALISLALSHRADRKWVQSFYEGMFRLARRFGVALLGGDTARHSGAILADVVVVGEVPQGKALLRSGAKPGDALFVAGTLGLSALGLEFLRSGKRNKNSQAFREAFQAHLYPEPQCDLGQHLMKRRLAAAAIDVSDGLSTDLGRLCDSSGVGAHIWVDSLPVPQISSSKNLSDAHLLHLALHGGEDYKLLFAVRPSKVARVPDSFEGIRIHRIGKICARRAKVLVLPNGAHKRLQPLGYDHFHASRQSA